MFESQARLSPPPIPILSCCVCNFVCYYSHLCPTLAPIHNYYHSAVQKTKFEVIYTFPCSTLYPASQKTSLTGWPGLLIVGLLVILLIPEITTIIIITGPAVLVVSRWYMHHAWQLLPWGHRKPGQHLHNLESSHYDHSTFNCSGCIACIVHFTSVVLEMLGLVSYHFTVYKFALSLLTQAGCIIVYQPESGQLIDVKRTST